MKTLDDLQVATRAFFDRHWAEAALPRPAWSNWERFLSGPVPNHDKSGCYALFAGAELLYVGVGASTGDEQYEEHGLSRRLTQHVLYADPTRGPQWSRLRQQWASVTGVHTIGFPPERAYLAAALETYLIRELRPRQNRRV